ncbi:hypothetical protein DL96DRAFT_1629449, partial [Flagelloscypha sp. PMI_526]
MVQSSAPNALIRPCCGTILIPLLLDAWAPSVALGHSFDNSCRLCYGIPSSASPAAFFVILDWMSLFPQSLSRIRPAKCSVWLFRTGPSRERRFPL